MMLLRGATTLASFLALALCSSVTSAAIVTFDSLAQGTQFGEPVGDSVGEVVHVEQKISMSVENYVYRLFTDFFVAEVGGRYAKAFPTPALDLNNIGVEFHFSDLPFAVTQVSMDFRDFGGINTFVVNDGEQYLIDPSVPLPKFVAPGITAKLTGSSLTLRGDGIADLLVGGQELIIDNIQAVPEPATALLLGVGIAALLRRRRVA